jgi:hypothetical protein
LSRIFFSSADSKRAFEYLTEILLSFIRLPNS